MKVGQERAVPGPHSMQEHEIFEEGRRSVCIEGRYGVGGSDARSCRQGRQHPHVGVDLSPRQAMF